MIFKEKTFTQHTDPKLIAGDNQEKGVAFHLRRAYKNNDQVFVLNDVFISHNGETAQIDHLLVHTYGFVIIESKSIKGNVAVNKHSEWSRSFNDKWTGMKSPIKQAELQAEVLRDFLNANRTEAIGKMLGLVQQGFSMRTYDVLCAISSDAIIDRSECPKDILPKLVKTEFIAEFIDKTIKHKKSFNVVGKILDTRPTFSHADLVSVSEFIVNNDPRNPISNTPKATPTEVDLPEKTIQEHYLSSEQDAISPVKNNDTTDVTPTIFRDDFSTNDTACKHCSRSDRMMPKKGKYGDYFNCGHCNQNTQAKSIANVILPKNTQTPAINQEVTKKIIDFNYKPSDQAQLIAEVAETVSLTPNETVISNNKQDTAKITCKHCGKNDKLKYTKGKWGAYYSCGHCSKNTQLKKALSNPPKDAQPEQTFEPVANQEPESTKQVASESTESKTKANNSSILVCKHCGHEQEGKHINGKFGKFHKCLKCQRTTTVK